MGCCKCEEYNWPDPQEVVWKDPADGKGYCVFHAQKAGKVDELGEQLDGKAFNSRVHKRISDARESNSRCVLLGAIFPWVIDFSKFNETEPLPSICFMQTSFEKGLSFVNSCFSERADFHLMKCKGVAAFDSAKFHDDAAFYSATFEKAFFAGTQFTNSSCQVSFNDSTFTNDVRFFGTNFNGKADFTKATFMQSATIDHVTFGMKTTFRAINGSSHKIKIQKMSATSLENLVYTRNDLQQISFDDCRWPDRLGLEVYGNREESNLLECEELYRAMKQRAVEEHDQPQVSHWHYREKLMALKRGNGIFETAILWPYWALSGFGEKPLRAGAWLLALVVLSFALHAIPEPLDWNSLWGANTINSILALIPYAKDLPGAGWIKLGYLLLFALIVMQARFIYAAVRNRFRR